MSDLFPDEYRDNTNKIVRVANLDEAEVRHLKEVYESVIRKELVLHACPTTWSYLGTATSSGNQAKRTGGRSCS